MSLPLNINIKVIINKLPFVKRVIKSFFLTPYRKLTMLIFIKLSNRSHVKKINLIKQKKEIDVIFFVIHRSVWKMDEVFNLMLKHENFTPKILICPFVTYGKTEMLKEMEDTFKFFIDKGYPVIRSCDTEGDNWLDVKSELKPDLIFFTNPNPITSKSYSIDNFKDYLTCYIPYFLQINHMQESQFNQPLHNLAWKIFHISQYHLVQARRHSLVQGKNVIVTGYPSMEPLINSLYNAGESVWKRTSNKGKRIIWAPHHTIEEDSELAFATFLEYAELMVELSKKYKEQIQFAFKPHPLLKNKLVVLESWGELKTEAYYRYWAESSNTQLEEGEYIDLFLTSDCLLHDSGSFLVEYLHVNKPVMYLTREGVRDRLNDYGQKAFDVHVHGKCKNDVIEFIEHTVLQGNDELKIDRENYLAENVYDNDKPSEKIMSFLESELML